MRNSILIVLLSGLTLFSGFLFFSSITGHTISSEGYGKEIFSSNGANIIISLKSGDHIPGQDVVFMSLSKNGHLIAANTLPFSEIISYALNKTQESGKEYSGPSEYSVQAETIAGYYLNETGDYDVFMQMPADDITQSFKITVGK